MQHKSLLNFFIFVNIVFLVLVFSLLSGLIYVQHGAAFLNDFWLHNSIWNYFVLLVIPLGLVALNLILVYSKILQYIEYIIELNERTEQGEFSVYPEGSIPNDEVGEFLRGRNRMITQLQRYQSSVLEELDGTKKQLNKSSRMRTVGEMALAIAHEVEEPVDELRRSINLIRKSLIHPSDEDLGRAIQNAETAYEQSKRLKNLISSMYDFNKLEEAWENYCLNDLVENTLALISKQFNFNEIELITELKAKESICYVEVGLLKQVLVNLLANAIDSMKQKAERKMIRVRSTSNTSAFILEISDSGCGIPQDKLHEIFSPFYTTKSKGNSAGLGLAIVEDIIKRHNGTLSVESIEAVGTKFIIKLPLSLKRS